MTTTINASTSAGLVQTADTSGSLALQTASTTALTLDTSQNATFAGSVKTNTLTSAASTALTLQSAGTTAITVDTSQNVGIGTSSPSYKMDVNVGSSGGAIRAYNTANTNTAYLRATNSQSSVQMGEDGTGGFVEQLGAYPLRFFTNNTEAMRIDSSGRLLVGSTFAYDSATFCVTSAVGQNRIIGFDGGGSGARGRFFIDAPAASQINLVVDGAGTMGFVQNATEMARFDSSRNLLVGNSSVGGTGWSIYPSGYSITNGSTSTFTHMSFQTSSSQKGYIQTVGATTNYNGSSDYRLKKNVIPLPNALQTIAQLKPVKFNWIEDDSVAYSFIAHELQEVVPQAVGGTKDEVDENGKPVYQGIDPSKLVCFLTAAIQELKAINDTQAETINALTARIVALEGR